MKKFPHAVTAERQAGDEIGQNDEPEDGVIGRQLVDS